MDVFSVREPQKLGGGFSVSSFTCWELFLVFLLSGIFLNGGELREVARWRKALVWELSLWRC
jgi:hypothetical protein